ncbi:MAG TPA: hypothetical protein VFZ61_03810 [Polyangiales bacterium]
MSALPQSHVREVADADDADRTLTFRRVGTFMGIPVIVEAGSEPPDPHCVCAATLVDATRLARRRP